MAEFSPKQTGRLLALTAVRAHMTVDQMSEAALQQAPPAVGMTDSPTPPPAAPPRAAETQAEATLQASEPQRVVGPPGRVGDLVDYLYDAAMYPCKEVAVCAALGLLAGFAGRAYTTPVRPTGLNVYLLLVGRSGSGKEALHEGPSSLMTQVQRRQPGARAFVNFHDFASGPALIKAAAEQHRCFVNYSSELGKLLGRMGNDRDANAQSIRNALTRLYSKSGPDSVVGDMRYSDREKHVVIDGGAAISLVGESTPGVALQALTQAMMEDGLLSRFQFVPMPAQDPDFNYTPAREAPEAIVQGLADLATHALTLLHRGVTQQVQFADVDAEDSLDAYRIAHRAMMKETPDELLRAVHSRAHLKALKYACLMAVAENIELPRITEKMVGWATMFADRGVQYMLARSQAGDVGTGDNTRERYVLKLIRRWLTEGVPASMPTVPSIMARDGVVPRKYLQQRTSDVAVFARGHHSLGSTALLDHTLRSMVDSGYIAEVEKAKAAEKYGFHGRCYYVVDLPEQPGG